MSSEDDGVVLLLSDPTTGTTIRYVGDRGDGSVESKSSRKICRRASSVLQKNVKVYGPKHVLDVNSPSTCWNSEAGESQWLEIDFGRKIQASRLDLQFQAGFGATICKISTRESSQEEPVGLDEWDDLEDEHEVQSFELSNQDAPIQTLHLEFSELADFYGRLIIYRLEVWGKEESKITSKNR